MYTKAKIIVMSVFSYFHSCFVVIYLFLSSSNHRNRPIIFKKQIVLFILTSSILGAGTGKPERWKTVCYLRRSS